MRKISRVLATVLFLSLSHSFFACGPMPSKMSEVAADQQRINVLYGDRRFDEMTWLTAHNAFVNNKDGLWMAPNQGTMSLDEQLRQGVTAIMLDVHSYKGKATLCHGSCNGIPLISPRQDFVAALNRVADHLQRDREALITIFLEDYTSHDELQAALKQSRLSDLIFDPYKEDVRGRGWPKVRDMVNADKRVFIVSDHGGKNDLGVASGRDFTVENYWSMGDLANDRACRSRWDDIPLDRREEKFERLFVMNHFRNVPTPITAAIDNRFQDIWTRLERECVAAARKKPNYIAVDYIAYADFGARRAVETANEARGIIFKDRDFRGATQMLLPGTIAVDHLIFGNDSLSSIKIFRKGSKVRLYREANFQDLIKEVDSSLAYVGDDANDQVSSLEID